jgi:hypothetical protein
MTRAIDLRLFLVAVATIGLAACNQTTPNASQPVTSMAAARPKPGVTIKAPYAPPPAMVETIPPKPAGPDDGYFVWNPGHYHWSSTSSPIQTYVWLPGGFVERPYQGSVWTNGNWTQTDGTWGWTPGYWN